MLWYDRREELRQVCLANQKTWSARFGSTTQLLCSRYLHDVIPKSATIECNALSRGKAQWPVSICAGNHAVWPVCLWSRHFSSTLITLIPKGLVSPKMMVPSLSSLKP